jgi:elongation factor P
VQFHGDRAINIELPGSVDVEVTETAPHMKGATATSSYKPATIETGTTVMVPPFIESGERIRVNPNSGEYIERAK